MLFYSAALAGVARAALVGALVFFLALLLSAFTSPFSRFFLILPALLQRALSQGCRWADSPTVTPQRCRQVRQAAGIREPGSRTTVYRKDSAPRG